MLDYTQLLISYGLPLLFPLVLGSMGTCVLLSAKKARFIPHFLLGVYILLLRLCNSMQSIGLRFLCSFSGLFCMAAGLEHIFFSELDQFAAECGPAGAFRYSVPPGFSKSEEVDRSCRTGPVPVDRILAVTHSSGHL